MTRALIDAAVDYARREGASMVEAYPVDRKTSKVNAAEAFTGLLDTFLKAGFREAARRSRRRVIVRRVL